MAKVGLYKDVELFKQLKKDRLVLELFCDVDMDPLTMLVRNAELFYYDNNNP